MSDAPNPPTNPSPGGGQRPVATSPVESDSSSLPFARLSTGVIIILLITMFASCSAMSNAQDAANNTANQQSTDTSGLATTQEVAALCKLLGAVAAKQGTDVNTVFKDDPSGTACQQSALEGSGRPR